MATTCTPIGLAVGSLTPPNQPVSCDPVFLAVGARTPVPPLTAVAPGSTVGAGLSEADVVADPQTEWAIDEHATVDSRERQWSGTQWLVWYSAPPAVANGIEKFFAYNVAHDADAYTPAFASLSAWSGGEYSRFTDGRFYWDGSAWQAGAAP